MERAGTLLRELRDSYSNWRANFWFLPAIIGVGSIVLFALTYWADSTLSFRNAITELPFWFSGSPQASRSLLSTIGGSLATVATVTFSISILTLQLASAQYTPRLLRSFTRSTASQATIGMFVATIIYAILSLSVVRDQAPGQTPFVPDIAVNVAKLMTLASLGLLLYFIGHIAKLISPSHIIRTARQDTLGAYKSFIESKIGEDALPEKPDSGHPVGVVAAGDSGYVQRIRMSRLLDAAKKMVDVANGGSAHVIMKVTIGDYLKKGDELALVFAETRPPEEARHDLSKAFVIGEARLSDQDFRYGADELLSIALRRINLLDSSTATECVSALTEVWLSMMKEPLYPPNRWIVVKENRVHVAMVPVDMDGQLARSLREIQVHAADSHLPDPAAAVVEGLCVVAAESIRLGKMETLDAAWPRLIWASTDLIGLANDPQIQARLRSVLSTARDAVREKHPERWEELTEQVRTTALRLGKWEPLRDVWAG